MHTYGSAGDVSGLLRAMESTDADVREEAMNRLWPAAWNDDDLAVATAGAVPRLARLALEGPGHREDLLRLLGSLATRPGWPSEEEPAPRAVADELPPLLPFAHHADPRVRDAMVLLIAACGREDCLPLLRRRLGQETDPPVRAHLVTALGLLDPGDGARRNALLTDPEPRVALAAAEDLLRTAELPLPEPLVDHCVRAYTADPHEPDPRPGAGPAQAVHRPAPGGPRGRAAGRGRGCAARLRHHRPLARPRGRRVPLGAARDGGRGLGAAPAGTADLRAATGAAPARA
ncbi:hypothetical protein UK15_09275 [Streptomyces variegatus]|uniref:PBS lyase n=1 Tax=Streptomyces variegatus TaxID=284040 RepID=A0A0M2GUH3_9ACTN|nr:hypothetical protein UK15_09275 [Streptomyces variegatus]